MDTVIDHFLILLAVRYKVEVVLVVYQCDRIGQISLLVLAVYTGAVFIQIKIEEADLAFLLYSYLQLFDIIIYIFV